MGKLHHRKQVEGRVGVKEILFSKLSKLFTRARVINAYIGSTLKVIYNSKFILHMKSRY